MSVEEEFDLVVDRVEATADDVVALTLRPEDPARSLPEWEPGAHIDLLLRDDLVRQYSLCGDPADRGRFRLGVLRQADGRGGSQFVYDKLVAGASVRVRGPRNNFPLVEAEKYLFIAGGIGITPFVPMLRGLDAEWTLVYGGRRRSSMAFLDELTATHGDRVQVVCEDETGFIDLDAVLTDLDPHTAVYVCGPEGLLLAVEARVPTAQLYLERFSPKEQVGLSPDAEFTVELARSGKTLTVPPDRPILDVLEDSGIDVMSSCREGTCGTCEVVVLEGEPEHRDSLLTDEERQSGDLMYICVSRSRGPRLVLDL